MTTESVRKNKEKSPLSPSKDVFGNTFLALALPAYVKQRIDAVFHFPQHVPPEHDNHYSASPIPAHLLTYFQFPSYNE